MSTTATVRADRASRPLAGTGGLAVVRANRTTGFTNAAIQNFTPPRR